MTFDEQLEREIGHQLKVQANLRRELQATDIDDDDRTVLTSALRMAYVREARIRKALRDERNRRARRMRLQGRVLLAAIVALVVALVVVYQPHEAIAHKPDPVACQIAWEAAPDGEKWTAKQACLAGQRRHTLAHECSGPRPLVPRTVTVKGKRAGVHQRQMLTRALNEARRMRAPRTHLVGVVAGMTQETVARNLNYGDRDSVGILQLRAMHGTRRWRLVPENSAGWFLRGARSIDPHGHAALRSSSDRRRDWGLIQRVQRSGHPRAYNRWLPESRHTVAAFLGACAR